MQLLGAGALGRIVPAEESVSGLCNAMSSQSEDVSEEVLSGEGELQMDFHPSMKNSDSLGSSDLADISGYSAQLEKHVEAKFTNMVMILIWCTLIPCLRHEKIVMITRS